MVFDRILHIKTHMPPINCRSVLRPQLQERLEMGLPAGDGFSRHLTLISAPAGFGKTTLLRNWLRNREASTAWLSLDGADNEPTRYWMHFIAAIQKCQPGVGDATLEMLRSGRLGGDLPEAPALLTPLLNDLLALNQPLFVALDDYHLIDRPDIHSAMVFLMENLPPSVHVAITTRSDPPWPLSRWRARGLMSETRLADLTFSLDETKKLFQQFPEITLTKDDIDALHQKTEGWVAGLQLAFLSLRQHPDPAHFVREFTGSQRHVFHFLSEEVFQQQEASVQQFLLQTSILDRLTPTLCDALTKRSDSARLLDQFETDNLFLLPLDDRGQWYRYHPLFAQKLRHELHRREPCQVATLHQRASQWLTASGQPGEALRHARKAGDSEEVARLLDTHFETILFDEGPERLLETLNLVSLDLLACYPRLLVHQAYSKLIYRGAEAARPFLERAQTAADEDEVVNPAFSGMVAALKSYYHIYTHDFEAANRWAAIALWRLPQDAYYWRINISVYSGDARLFASRPREALTHYQAAYATCLQIDNHYLALSTGFKVATAHYYRGELAEAEALTHHLLQKARDHGFSEVSRVGLLWTLKGELLRESGDLEGAERCIQRGLHYSRTEKPSWAWNALFQVALHLSRQAPAQAHAVLDALEALHREVTLPYFITLPVAIYRARLYLLAGKPDDAQSLLKTWGIEEPVSFGFGHEPGMLLLGECRGQAGDFETARSLIRAVLEHAQKNGYRGLEVDAFLALAWVEMMADDLEAAGCALKRAIQRGHPRGYRQRFRDVYPQLKTLIDRLAPKALRPSPEEAAALWETMVCDDGTDRETADAKGTSTSRPPADLNWVEPLTRREHEILGELVSGFSNQEIAEHLFVSVGTVKWHTSNIYGKLGVRNRTEAVVFATEQGLIDDPTPYDAPTL